MAAKLDAHAAGGPAESALAREVQPARLQPVLQLVADPVVAQGDEHRPPGARLDARHREGADAALVGGLVGDRLRSLDGIAQVGPAVLVDRLSVQVQARGESGTQMAVPHAPLVLESRARSVQIAVLHGRGHRLGVPRVAEVADEAELLARAEVEAAAEARGLPDRLLVLVVLDRVRVGHAPVLGQPVEVQPLGVLVEVPGRCDDGVQL